MVDLSERSDSSGLAEGCRDGGRRRCPQIAEIERWLLTLRPLPLTVAGPDRMGSFDWTKDGASKRGLLCRDRARIFQERSMDILRIE